MPIPASINDLSQTAGSNSPAGSESPALIDDYLRTYASYIAQLRDGFRPDSTAVGVSRNASMFVSTAAATATFTASEFVVKTALGGTSYVIPSVSQLANLATTGINAMDTGPAPVSGDVAGYVIYNPTTKAYGMLYKDVTGSAVPEIYGGVNPVSGYTASGLAVLWKTNASRQFTIGYLFGRHVDGVDTSLLASTTAQGFATSLNIAPVVPFGAKSVNLMVNISANTADVNFSTSMSGTSTLIGLKQFLGVSRLGGSGSKVPFGQVPIVTPGSVYYTAVVGSGGLNYVFTTTGYDF